MPDLQRFVDAQDDGATYDRAVGELRAGRKMSYWMWFVFPQITGLGRSAMAQHYALDSVGEARAYLAHDVLGPRLRECCDALLEHRGQSAEQILGGIDAVKLRSSMTLFELADDGESRFADVLDAFFGGERDEATLSRV